MSKPRNPERHVCIRWVEFAAALLSVRKFAKLSEDDVALKCHVGHATVHRAEHGKPVGASAFIALCVFINRDPRDFISEPKS